jgi:hypothetical protein
MLPWSAVGLNGLDMLVVIEMSFSLNDTLRLNKQSGKLFELKRGQ